MPRLRPPPGSAVGLLYPETYSEPAADVGLSAFQSTSSIMDWRIVSYRISYALQPLTSTELAVHTALLVSKQINEQVINDYSEEVTIRR